MVGRGGRSGEPHNHTTTQPQPRKARATAVSHAPCPAAWIERDEMNGWETRQHSCRISQAPVHGGCPKPICVYLPEPVNLQ